MESYKGGFIDFLIKAQALKFGEFTTKSGRKSPFFINIGNFSSGEALNQLADFYAEAVVANFGQDFDILFGPAYKGIPLSVAVSMKLYEKYGIHCHYASIRKEIKDHGDKGLFLGQKPTDESRILLIEDVTTAGTSIYETMPLLRAQANVDVVGLLIAVDRQERGKTEENALVSLEKEFNFKAASIVTMAEVVSYLWGQEKQGKVWIDDALKKQIDAYYAQYGAK